IYASSRKRTEELSEFLNSNGFKTNFLHAGWQSEIKREVLDQFSTGECSVVCATNAFGMGIDKDNVRLVIHLDIPGSMENYLQEAGRAGRDREQAHCILLYDPTDVETQFSLGALSEIRKGEIEQILRGIRSSCADNNKEVVLTTDELLRTEELSGLYDDKDQMKDTKVKTAISWLEKAGYLKRNQNFTQVFQGKIVTSSIEEGEKKIDQLNLTEGRCKLWKLILNVLFNAPADQGISADQIAEQLFLNSSMLDNITKISKRTPAQEVIHVMHEMDRAGILEEGLLLTAYIKPKGINSAVKRLEQIILLDEAMIKQLQEEDPESDNGEWVELDIQHLNGRLASEGTESNKLTLLNLLKSLSMDGKGFALSTPSVDLKQVRRDRYRIRINRNWSDLIETASRRRKVAGIILGVLQNKALEILRKGGVEEGKVLVSFSSSDLTDVIEQDIELGSLIRNGLAAMDRGLMFLHENKIISMQNGLAIFRQALTLQLLPEANKRRYNQTDYQPLALHYKEKIFQIHVMSEYAKVAIDVIQKALSLVLDYFSMSRQRFINRYFADRKDLLEIATGLDSYQNIVESLNNPIQIATVKGDIEKNTLILAGPGSGKSRIIVHRCAYLLRMERIPADHILILCFNQSAAIHLRKQLIKLVGKEAHFVTILTYHGLAIRLTGKAPTDWMQGEQINFDGMIKDAIALLKGENIIPGLESDELRERLLAGYSHILVDEYQDIDEDQYNLVSALTGRTLQQDDKKLTIMAVGDDDQNIYTFRGTNIRFIQKFQDDYAAQTTFLIENYRSTQNIIESGNRLIQQNQDRMKSDTPIRINQSRSHDFSGRKTRISCFPDLETQAILLVDAIQEMVNLNSELNWSDFAVLSRTRNELHLLRSIFEDRKMPCQWTLRDSPNLTSIREIHDFLEMIYTKGKDYIRSSTIIENTNIEELRDKNPWYQILFEALNVYRLETNDSKLKLYGMWTWIYQYMLEKGRENNLGEGIFLNTIHGAKGLEFEHVFILGGGWRRSSRTNSEEERRILYVGMTRAMNSLWIGDIKNNVNPCLSGLEGDLFNQTTLKNSLKNQIGTFRRYSMLGMKDLFLSFAAQYPEDHLVHRNISRINIGDTLKIQVINASPNSNLGLLDKENNLIAMLSKSASTIWSKKLDTILDVRVLAMVRRKNTNSNKEYLEKNRIDSWEVPLVEIVSV
ncbi:MAG: UvrD-helicase domain-containing protein, partial [Proteobacteria bacterium]|nr:UvrD-helicase domain-containing protein [Pseudomonadota bacterium]